MSNDARAAAWITAWDCLVEADRCRKKSIEVKIAEARDAYRTSMEDLQRQGELFAALANASTQVGMTAGVELEHRATEERERNDRNRRLFDQLQDEADEEVEP